MMGKISHNNISALHVGVPLETSITTLYQWLMQYGFEPTSAQYLHYTNYDRHLDWSLCEDLGIITKKSTTTTSRHMRLTPSTSLLALTPKVLEVLERYDGKQKSV